MSRVWIGIQCLTLGALLLAGCDARESLEHAFRDAPSGARDQIAEALQLDRANNYMSAAEHYDAVLNGDLNAQQKKAVQAAINQLFARMCKAAAQGDAEAKRTLETIQANRRAAR